MGYYTVALRKNSKTIKKRIHTIIAEAFVPNPLNKTEVNHINGIKTDNRIENLELTTTGSHIREHSKGYRDGYAKGLIDGRKIDVAFDPKTKRERMRNEDVEMTRGITIPW